jgi:hypothetical protein
VTLERIPELAATGADFVSVGALTHSAPAIDISFEIAPSFSARPIPPGGRFDQRCRRGAAASLGRRRRPTQTRRPRAAGPHAGFPRRRGLYVSVVLRTATARVDAAAAQQRS